MNKIKEAFDEWYAKSFKRGSYMHTKGVGSISFKAGAAWQKDKTINEVLRTIRKFTPSIGICGQIVSDADVIINLMRSLSNKIKAMKEGENDTP